MNVDIIAKYIIYKNFLYKIPTNSEEACAQL